MCVCVCWCISIHIIYIFRYVSFKRVSRDRRLNIFGYIISTSTYIKAERSQFLFCVMCMLFSNLALLMLYERALSLSLSEPVIAQLHCSQEEEEEDMVPDMVTRHSCHRQPCPKGSEETEEVQHLVSLIHLLVGDRTKVEH